MRLGWTRRFTKEYQHLEENVRLKVDTALLSFQENPFLPTLYNHALHGKLEGLRTLKAGYNTRIIFFEENGRYEFVSLVSVGTHDRVYRK